MVKDEVLRALERNRGTRFSGGRLAQELGVSRAAVWKAIEALRADGLAIESTPGGGYCLSADDDSLTAAGVASLLETEVLGRDLLVVPETGSTNTAIKQEYAASRAEGFTLIAEQQTAGRGRLGRTFCSPPGGGLYMSLLLRPHLPLDRLNFLTIAAAVAVCRAIESTAGFRPGIKWVNDVLMDGKKLCGILTEMGLESETNSLQYLVTGIGVNVNQTPEDFDEEVRSIATSLSMHLGRPVRRSALAVEIIRALDKMYAGFPANKQEYLDRYRADCMTTGKQVQLITPVSRQEAVALSIDDEFRLVVQLPDGTQKALSAGEVSVRGMYGYV